MTELKNRTRHEIETVPQTEVQEEPKSVVGGKPGFWKYSRTRRGFLGEHMHPGRGGEGHMAESRGSETGGKTINNREVTNLCAM